MRKKISIIGSGYVGLITGLVFAMRGNDTKVFDRNQELVNKINKGISPFFEPDLELNLKNVIKNKNLSASIGGPEEMADSDYIFICVGTPSINGKISLRQVNFAARKIAHAIRISNKYITVVIKSTVVPGTTENLVRNALEKFSGKKCETDFGVAMNPEFLREGSAVYDATHPDRIVLGCINERTAKNMKDLYEEWKCPLIITNPSTAEYSKYVNNTLLAILISASNELSNIAETIGSIDYRDVLNIVKLDKRWKSSNSITEGSVTDYLRPGCGFGGSCFPKDIIAINRIAKDHKLKTKIIEGTINVNKHQYKFVLNKLYRAWGFNFYRKKVLVLGITFKPNTDDIRESVSLSMMNDLVLNKVKVIASDPMLSQINHNNIPKEIILVRDWRESLKVIDAIILATEWKEYLELPKIVQNINPRAIILDTRNFYKTSKFNNIYLANGIN